MFSRLSAAQLSWWALPVGFGLMDECVAGDTEGGKLVRVL